MHRYLNSLFVLVVAIAIGCYFYYTSASIKMPTSVDPGMVERVEGGSGGDWDARLEQKLEKLPEIKPDDAWFKVLPEGFEFKHAEPFGQSYYSHSAFVTGELPSGEEKKYFLKLSKGELGLAMTIGEYESIKALHAVSPNFIPNPIGIGTYASDPEMHFFLIDFVEMSKEYPDKVSLCTSLAKLHRDSITHPSNTGKYGFDTTTYNAKLPQDNRWTSSWEDLYLRHTKQLFDMEREAQGGPSPELESLLPSLYNKVIPRLLRPLETGNNSISPVLIHGDLWDANTAVRATDGAPLIFDASSFWAHNECELGMWRPARMKLRMDYVEEYFRHYPKSEPQEDWEDRNLLYSLRPEVQDSTLFPSTGRFREIVIEVVRTLVEKYPNGYEGSEKMKGT